MKYFYDTEFLEGTQNKRFLGILYGKTLPTIDLISIGIVSEDGREYYAISKDFNLKEAWNRYDMKQVSGDARNRYPEGIKEYWIRENVLKPIYYEMIGKDISFHDYDKYFTYSSMKNLINKQGKANKQIACEVLQFTVDPGKKGFDSWLGSTEEYMQALEKTKVPKIELYGYYTAYDHVVLCWLFGKMIDLPKGFPMYTKDLKQMLDKKLESLDMYYARDVWGNRTDSFMQGDLQKKDRPATLAEKLKGIKLHHPSYPKQTNEHNALADARWNLELYNFIKTL